MLQGWTLRSGEDSVDIAARGALVTAWRVTDSSGTRRDLIDGYRNDEEAQRLSGYRSAVLAPWSNRIRDARFVFDEAASDLGSDENGVREALHGLVADATFVELERGEDFVQAACQIAATDAYPYPLQVHVLYRLWGTQGRHRLELVLKVANTGQSDAPVTLGWHPYLRYQGPRELASIVLPAVTAIRTDPANIPLPGQDAFVDLSENIGGAFTPDQRVSCLGQTVVIQAPAGLDHAFTDVHRDNDEWVRAYLRHGDGTEVAVEFQPDEIARGVGVFQVFTGEPLEERSGEAVAIEPCLAMTDAFNRSECACAIRLAPGQIRSLRAGLSFSESATSSLSNDR